MKRTLSAVTSFGEEVTLDTFEKKTNPSSPLSCNSKASCRVEPEPQIILRDLHATSSESRDPPQQTDRTIAATVSGDTRNTDTCTETGIDTDADAYSAPGSPSLEAADFVAEAYRDVDAGLGCSPYAAWCGGAQDDVAVVGLVVGKVASDANALCLCRGSFDEDAISLLSGSGGSFADDATIGTYGSVESQKLTFDEDDLLSLTPRPTTAATTPANEVDLLSLTPRPTTAATTPASAGEEVTLEKFIGGNDGASNKVLEGQDDNEVTEKDLPTITSDLTLSAGPTTNERKYIANDDDSNKDDHDDNTNDDDSADWHGVQRGMIWKSFVTSTSSHSEIPDFLCNATCDAVNDSSDIALTSAAKTSDESTRTNLGEPKEVKQKKEETETILVSCGDMLRNPFSANTSSIKTNKPETEPQVVKFSGDNAKENNDGDNAAIAVVPVCAERTSATLVSAWEEMMRGNTNASADMLNILLKRGDGRPVPSSVPSQDRKKARKVVTKKNRGNDTAAPAEALVGTERTSATLASAWEEMTRGNTNASADILNILLEHGDGRPVPSSVPLKRNSQDRKKAQKVVTNQRKLDPTRSMKSRKDTAKTRVVTCMVLNREVIAREKDMSMLTALGVPTKFDQDEEETILATTPTKARKDNAKSLMKKAKLVSRMKLKTAGSFRAMFKHRPACAKYTVDKCNNNVMLR